MAFDASKLAITTVLARAVGCQVIALDGSGRVWHVLYASDPLPAEAKWTVQTVVDDQLAIELELFEQSSAIESEQLDHNLHLASIRLFLPPVSRGTNIEMTLAVDVEGILRVSAREPSSGHVSSREASLSILTDEGVAQPPPDPPVRIEGGGSDRTPAFGIHLGATHVSVAWEDDFGQVVAVPNYDGAFTTPSAVYFEADSTVLVGTDALTAQWLDPQNGCFNIKRHIGSDYMQEFRGQGYTPEGVLALILKELVGVANDQVGKNVNKVALTVPAYFGNREKEATKTVGLIAGLEVVGLVPEPVAYVLSEGAKSQPETLLMYKLGGHSFDLTVLRSGGGEIQTLAIDGDRALGGLDWSEALAQLIAEKFAVQAELSGEDPRLDADFDRELLEQAEHAKRRLALAESATVRCRYRGADELVGVTRVEFDAVSEHLVARTLKITERVMSAVVEASPDIKIDRLLLCGGASRMPRLHEALERALNIKPVMTDFDVAAAKGAAIYAGMVREGPIA